MKIGQKTCNENILASFCQIKVNFYRKPAIQGFYIPLFKCGNLSSLYADLNFKFVIVQVLFIDKHG